MEEKEKVPGKEIPVPNEEEQEREGQTTEETGNKTWDKKFGSGKPEFKRPQQCEVVDAIFKTDGIRVTTTQRDGQTIDLDKDMQYSKHWLSVKFKYVDKETQDERIFEQSYGSIREYDNRLWMGQANALAKLKETLEAFQSVPLDDVKDISKELKGLKCLVKSVPWSFGTRSGMRLEVQDFIEEEDKP